MTKLLDLIFILSFLIITSAPSLLMLVDATSQTSSFENRNLAKFPNLVETKYTLLPESINNFFNDHFALRNALLKWKTFIDTNYLQISSNLYMVQGKKGYYFLNPIRPKDPNPNLNYKTLFFQEAELKTIKKVLEEEYSWHKQRNIAYMFVIVPDKEAVYSEYFPYPNSIITNYKLDQLVSYLEQHSTFRILDLRTVLINAKKQYPNLTLYYKGDSHWNQFGSLIAYQEIIRQLQFSKPDVYVPELSDFEILNQNNEVIAGDITRMGKLSEGEDEITAKITPKPNLLAQKKLKKVYIYGDSYAKNTINNQTVGIVPFLHHSFDEVIEESFVTPKQMQREAISPLDFDLIEKDKPDLVIREVIQRNMRILLGYKNRVL